MYAEYTEMVRNSTPGRLEGEPPMTAFLDELYLNGDSGDDEVNNESGDGFARYGKRVLSWSSQGFISSKRFASAAEAEAFMAEMHTYYDDEEEV